jgi:hypothetical protein
MRTVSTLITSRIVRSGVYSGTTLSSSAVIQQDTLDRMLGAASSVSADDGEPQL